MRMLCAFVATVCLSGCKLLPEPLSAPPEVVDAEPRQESSQFCLVDNAEAEVAHNCDLMHWLEYWTNADILPWKQRKTQIDALGNSATDIMQKVLLSQGKDTPYQDRLRAQSWLAQISPKMSSDMQALWETLIYQPSQEILEYESAIAILTRMNAEQSEALESQQEILLRQQKQIDDLLKIEASMMETKEGINQ